MSKDTKQNVFTELSNILYNNFENDEQLGNVIKKLETETKGINEYKCTDHYSYTIAGLLIFQLYRLSGIGEKKGPSTKTYGISSKKEGLTENQKTLAKKIDALYTQQCDYRIIDIIAEPNRYNTDNVSKIIKEPYERINLIKYIGNNDYLPLTGKTISWLVEQTEYKFLNTYLDAHKVSIINEEKTGLFTIAEEEGKPDTGLKLTNDEIEQIADKVYNKLNKYEPNPESLTTLNNTFAGLKARANNTSKISPSLSFTNPT